MRDYNSQNYTNAFKKYEQLAQVYTNDLRLVFNAGEAAYRATNFDAAQKNFQAVTLSPDLKLQQQAFYNLGNAHFRKAKQSKDLDGLEQGFERGRENLRARGDVEHERRGRDFQLRLRTARRNKSAQLQGGDAPREKQRRTTRCTARNFIAR